MDRLPFGATCAAMLFFLGLARASSVGGEERIADWSLFESIDADRSGCISQQEAQLYDLEHPEAQPFLADVDADRNGAISWHEWAFHGIEGSGDEIREAGSAMNTDSVDDGSRDSE